MDPWDSHRKEGVGKKFQMPKKQKRRAPRKGWEDFPREHVYSSLCDRALSKVRLERAVRFGSRGVAVATDRADSVMLRVERRMASPSRVAGGSTN